MLCGESLVKSYDSNVALHSGHHIVRPGEISVVLGLNGSGKSTLHRALGLVDVPEAGTVNLDGKVLFPLPEGAPAIHPWPSVTLVFQGLHLWPHLTLRENIELPLRKQPLIARRKVVEESISLFRMERFIDRYPNQVSGGERQRAAIARAFAVQPKYILLDECAALDVEQRALFVDHLLELRKRGIGVSLITHWMGFARTHADWISVLDHGKTVETGPRSILEKPESPALQLLLNCDQQMGD